jgi:hypothetical protein
VAAVVQAQADIGVSQVIPVTEDSQVVPNPVKSEGFLRGAKGNLTIDVSIDYMAVVFQDIDEVMVAEKGGIVFPPHQEAAVL